MLLRLITLLIFLSGCGYQFQGSGSALPSDIKKIYIPTVQNNTTEGSLSGLMTEALIDKFESYGVLEVVDNSSDADAVLNLKIVKLNRSSRSSSAGNDTSLQQDTSVEVAADIKQLSTGAIVWSNPSLRVSSVFGTNAGAVVTTSSDFASGGLSAANLAELNSRELARGQEGEAFEKIAEETAKKIYIDAVMPEF